MSNSHTKKRIVIARESLIMWSMVLYTGSLKSDQLYITKQCGMLNLDEFHTYFLFLYVVLCHFSAGMNKKLCVL